MTPFIDIHTHGATPSAEGVIALRNYRLGVDAVPPPAPYSAGVHPWDADAVDVVAAERLLSGCDCAAIGEIGIDKYAGGAHIARQTALLEMQLAVAARRRLPVIIHCVKAFEEVMAVLGKYDLPAVVFHGYIGNTVQTSRIMEREYFVSAGTRSFSSPKTVEALRSCPTDRLFLETDDSATRIDVVYGSAAALLGTDVDMLKRTIYDNFNRVFPQIKI